MQWARGKHVLRQLMEKTQPPAARDSVFCSRRKTTVPLYESRLCAESPAVWDPAWMWDPEKRDKSGRFCVQWPNEKCPARGHFRVSEAVPAKKRRDPQNKSGLAKSANPVCFGSGADETSRWPKGHRDDLLRCESDAR